MPPVLAAIPLALAAAGTAAAGAAVTGVGVAGAAGLAASLDIGLTAASAIIAGGTSLVLGTVEALLAPKAPTPVSQPTQLTFQQDPVEQRSWCYGTGASAGSVKYWETTGDSNNTVWYVSAVHDTPCDSFTLFFIDHDAVDFDPGTGDVTTAKYIAESGPKMWRYDHLGLHNQDADSRLVTYSASEGSGLWTDDHRLLGIAYFVWALQYNPIIYPQGAPTPQLVLQGRKLWDPRDAGLEIVDVNLNHFTTASPHGLSPGDMVFIRDNPSTFINQQGNSQIIEHEWQVSSTPSSTTFLVVGPDAANLVIDSEVAGGTATKMNWSNNAALALLDYLIGPHLQGRRIGGCGIPLSGLNLDTFIEGGNISDEQIDLRFDVGTVSRYTVDGFVGSLEDKTQVISAMLFSMGCGAGAGGLSIEQGQICLHAGAAEVATITLTDHDLAGPITINPSKSLQDKHNTYNSSYYDYNSNTGLSAVPERTSDTYKAEDGGLTLEANPVYRFTSSLPTAERLDKIGLLTEREQLQTDAVWKPKAKRIPLFGTYYWTSAAAGYEAKKMRVVERHHMADGSVRLISREENDAKWDWDADTEEVAGAANGQNDSGGGGTIAPTSFDAVESAGTKITATCDDPGDADLRFHVEYELHGDDAWIPIIIGAETYTGTSAVITELGTYDVRGYFVSQATGVPSTYVYVNDLVIS
jgi:hypothetical protein